MTSMGALPPNSITTTVTNQAARITLCPLIDTELIT